MSQRAIEETREFSRGPKKLGKEHRGLASKIRDTQYDLATYGRIEGIDLGEKVSINYSRVR